MFWAPAHCSSLNPLQASISHQIADPSPIRNLWVSRSGSRGGWVQSHLRVALLGIEDAAGIMTPDRTSSCILPKTVDLEECSPLVMMLPVRHTTVPELGSATGANENDVIVGVVDEAETEVHRGNVEGTSRHCQEMV